MKEQRARCGNTDSWKVKEKGAGQGGIGGVRASHE